MLSPDGSASSVVVSGANTAWPTDDDALVNLMVRAVQRAAVVMLQREIPERVNLAAAAASSAAGAIVLLDAGGVDAPMHPASLIAAVDYLCAQRVRAREVDRDADRDGRRGPSPRRNLLDAGRAARVLVTLGARGAALVTRDDVVMYPAVDVPGGAVVDATAAGDAFRAAFAISLAESDGEPTRAAARSPQPREPSRAPPRGRRPRFPRERRCARCFRRRFARRFWFRRGRRTRTRMRQTREPDGECPLRFGSRLNSMKSRPELWRNGANGGGLGALEMVARLGTAEGIDLVDFNYPQHLDGLAVEDVVATLASAGIPPRAPSPCASPPTRFSAGARSPIRSRPSAPPRSI